MPLANGLSFAHLFDASANPTALFDRELRFLAANTAFLRLTGLVWEQIVGVRIFDALEVPDEGSVRASVEKAFATGEHNEIPFARYSNDRTVSISNSIVPDDTGRGVWLLHQLADVTGLRAEAVEQPGLGIFGRASRSADELEGLRQVFQQAPGFAALVRGPDHRLVLANAAALELIGRDASVVGQTIAEVLPEVQSQGFIGLLDNVFATKTPFVGRSLEVELRREGGSRQLVVDMVYQPIVTDGEMFGIFILGQDITGARTAERKQSRLQAKYRELIEIAPQQVWTATPVGQLDSVNQQTVAYFGKPYDAIIGDGWQAVIHPEDLPETIEAWTHSLATGDLYQRYFRLRSAAGEYRWHLARATPVRGDDGEVFVWIGTNTDVHDARLAHDELLQRATYEEKLIGVVSHDLRNPLATIVLALSVLEGVELPPEAIRAMTHVKNATKHAEHLIADLMDFAQARSGNFPIAPTPTNLTTLIKPAVEAAILLAGKRDVVIEHHGPQLGAWDEGRLIQVLGNLIGNAFQHAPANAAIRVTSRIAGDRTTIDVFNEGTAIAHEDRARLFDPFARGRNARTKRGRSIGLGLYIAQQIARAHGGEITVDSAPDRGTTFTVALPTRATT